MRIINRGLRYAKVDRPARKGGYHPEFVDQAKAGRLRDRRPADRGPMENVGIVLADRLWSGKYPGTQGSSARNGLASHLAESGDYVFADASHRP
jgi:hypothetical protein